MINPRWWRYQIIQYLLGIICILIIGKIFVYQTSPEADAFREGGDLNLTTLYPARGEIYDRNGNLLAGNKTVYEVGVDLNTVRQDNNAEALALALSVNAGLDYAKIYSSISLADVNQNYVVLADNVPAEAVDKLKAYKIELANKSGTSSSAKNIVGKMTATIALLMPSQIFSMSVP